MGRNCPRCNAETNTRKKDVEGGTVTFESCPDCPHRTHINTRPKGSQSRRNVDMGLDIPTEKQWKANNE